MLCLILLGSSQYTLADHEPLTDCDSPSTEYYQRDRPPFPYFRRFEGQTYPD